MIEGLPPPKKRGRPRLPRDENGNIIRPSVIPEKKKVYRHPRGDKGKVISVKMEEKPLATSAIPSTSAIARDRFIHNIVIGMDPESAARKAGYYLEAGPDVDDPSIPKDFLSDAIRSLQNLLITWRDLHTDARKWFKVALNAPGVPPRDRNVAAGLVLGALKTSGTSMDETAESEDKAIEGRIESARRLLEDETIDVEAIVQ